MHEMSLVQGLFQQLVELAEENGASRVLEVTMEIGPLSGVVEDSFRFAFDILCSETPLCKGASLAVEVPPVIYTCSECGHQVQSNAERPEACPACSDPFLIPSGGDGLILKRVQME